MIYADHAATTSLDPDAFECMKEYLINDYGNPSQPYSFSRSVRTAIRDARVAIAECIGAEPEEIFFTSGGTESDNWALKGYAKKNKKRGVVVSAIEHHAVLNAANSLISDGFKVTKINVTKEGIVKPSFLQAVINEDTSIVSVMLGNNEIGSIQPICELAEIVHKYGAAMHTDAVQAVGHIKIDVKELGVDMLSASAHKFNGPKGIGFLYIKKGLELNPLMDGGSQESHMRAGTENVAAIIGMSVALKKNTSNIEGASEHLFALEEELIKGLRNRKLDFIRNGSDIHLPGNISLSFKNMDGELLMHRLDLMGIFVSTGSACDSKSTQLSHVIKAISVPEAYVKGTIRISLGNENTREDIDGIVNALDKIIAE